MTAHSALKDRQIEELAIMAVVEDPVVTEEDPVVVAVAVAVEEPVVDEVAKADAGAIAQQTAPRTPNSMQAQKLTAGLVVLMSPKSMIVIPVATNCRDTKIQQLALIQKEAP
jgi:hypothetical protein